MRVTIIQIKMTEGRLKIGGLTFNLRLPAIRAFITNDEMAQVIINKTKEPTVSLKNHSQATPKITALNP